MYNEFILKVHNFHMDLKKFLKVESEKTLSLRLFSLISGPVVVDNTL
jgi:hypothetical protein